MTRFGLDQFLEDIPRRVRGKRLGVLCHGASVTSALSPVLEVFAQHPSISIGAVFGPQHGLFGQTQANMIEWEGSAMHPLLNVPVYSLYGEHRKPTREMLSQIDALVVDLCDVGARLYTYIWTVKLCMEACAECGIPVVVLDRPNPIAALDFDGPLLEREFFTFVGGASIPMCHRMTMGELALFIKEESAIDVELLVVKMSQWQRDSLYSETGLPWVLPSPNIPTPDSTFVYPGMVLLEGTTMSEGRGTTRPFEFFGSPQLDTELFWSELVKRPFAGAVIREHGFVPTFDKFAGKFCRGYQLHVTNPRAFNPVTMGAFICDALYKTAGSDFSFLPPPYEYEREKLPFDILAGDSSLRLAIMKGALPSEIRKEWQGSYGLFLDRFRAIALYPETLS